ncbi:hypothetical protein [Siccirubricoccus sp. G192]|jgi:hypothetical protein|uniref:hypothetical protein n=1 Tax=Siccirubricoccus sp. G192 TaxID=2849651 RepID=UPI001C2C1878|nr:hypothetical protein [Siccirubricoccus sp. G192]MBV1798432.1 hypothetical protein [Siccirubricoccus sp. G192]
MRILPALAVLGLAMAVSACTYVERQPAQPTVVTPAPTIVQPQAAPPTVTVRPSY